MDRIQILPEGSWNLTAHNFKSCSLQNSFKLTFENFYFSCTEIHTPPRLKVYLQYSAPRL